MHPLDETQFLQLRQGAEVLEADGHGEKVLRLADGSYLKLFRRKRLFTSAAFYPYAQRFADNAQKLRQQGIACPEVLAVYRVASRQRDAVHYSPLPGQTIRQLAGQTDAQPLLSRLGAFLAELHDKGIYFRSLHLGNIVLTPERTFGLIDIADLRCRNRPLTPRLRLRNFSHLFRYRADRAWLLGDQGERFLSAYLAAASLPWDHHQLARKLNLPNSKEPCS